MFLCCKIGGDNNKWRKRYPTTAERDGKSKYSKWVIDKGKLA